MIHAKKLEQLLACFFYEHQRLPIPSLGTFRLTAPPATEAHGKHASIPPGNITFTWDPKQEVDEELVAYVMKETGKMKALAVADLLSLAGQAREMLNIRQPFTFESVGTLHMNPKGEVVLGGRTTMTSIPVAASHEPLQEAIPPDLSPSTGKTQVHPGTLLAVAGIVILLGLTSYFYFFRRGTTAPFLFPAHEKEQVRIKEPSSGDPGFKEAAPAPVVDDPPSVPADGKIQYEVVFETSHRTRALDRYKELTSWGHHIILSTNDSVLFTLAVPFTTLPEDTTAMKDSIEIQYGRPVYIRYP